MMDQDRRGWFLIPATLVAASLILALPVFRGAYATYLDNGPHLAEIHALATETTGWGEVANGGLPLSLLHSPLAYGALAAAARAGFPLDPLYAAAIWACFLAPAAAVYAVARRRIAPVPAGLIAFLVLVQRPSIEGIASPLGGMWTFALAAALWILLIDRLSEDDRSIRRIAVVGALFGLIGLLHTFVTVAAALTFAVHAAMRLASRRPGATRGVGADLLAASLGALAASPYWLPAFLTRAEFVTFQQAFTPLQILVRLLLPSDAVAMGRGSLAIETDLFLTDAIPMVLLVVGGCVGALRLRGRRHAAPALGLASAAILLVLVAAVVPRRPIPALGWVPWRYVELARLGLALAALPWLERLRLGTRRGLVVVGCVAALACAAWWGRPLAIRASVPAAEMAEVRELWSWLRDNVPPGAGRVALQDTFGAAPRSSALRFSHILALTSRQTGHFQVGPWYGVVPFRTGWTSSEFGAVLGVDRRGPAEVEELLRRLRVLHAPLLVISDPIWAHAFARHPGLREIARLGRFTVFETSTRSPGWSEGWIEGTRVLTTAFRPGRIAIDAVVENAPGGVLVKTAHHPFWHLSGPAGVRLEREPGTSLIAVVGLPSGSHRLLLEWRAPRWPILLGVAGWAGLVLLASVPRRRGRE